MRRASVNEMTDRGTVLIGSEGGDHVSIIRGKPDREGWSKAEIEVRCDGWTGRFLGSFQSGELARFACEVRKLVRTLNGSAKLHPMDPNIDLALIGDGKGHVKVEGEAQNNFASGTKLIFEFEIDQTYLIRIAEALEEADPEPGAR
jgi:hypothetical protein